MHSQGFFCYIFHFKDPAYQFSNSCIGLFIGIVCLVGNLSLYPFPPSLRYSISFTSSFYISFHVKFSKTISSYTFFIILVTFPSLHVIFTTIFIFKWTIYLSAQINFSVLTKFINLKCYFATGSVCPGRDVLESTESVHGDKEGHHQSEKGSSISDRSSR